MRVDTIVSYSIFYLAHLSHTNNLVNSLKQASDNHVVIHVAQWLESYQKQA